MQEKKTGHVTLRELARDTGFSVNTVSKALRDMPDISEQTKDIIRKTARKMGYVGNSMASALRSGFSNVLALIVSDISNPFFGILCKEIEQQAAKHNYTVIVFNTEEDALREERAIRTALSQNVDGVLLTPSQHSKEGIQLLQEHKMPCVLIGRYFSDIPADAVLFDDEHGGYLAGRHLLDCGCRNVLMINAPRNSSAENRSKGFERAIKEANCVKSRLLTINSPLGGVMESLKVAYKDDPFDGVFAYSDLVAMEAACALEEIDVDIDTVKLVGFDDIQSRLALPLPLTSVSAGKASFGEALVSLLMQRITGNKEDFPTQKILPTTLVVRKSTVSK